VLHLKRPTSERRPLSAVYGRFRYSDLKEADRDLWGFEWRFGEMTSPSGRKTAKTLQFAGSNWTAFAPVVPSLA